MKIEGAFGTGQRRRVNVINPDDAARLFKEAKI